MIDEQRRLGYLRAMGVTQWQQRDSLEPAPEIAEPVPLAEAPEPTPAVVTAAQAGIETSVQPPATVVHSEAVGKDDWQALRQQVRECRACELRSGCSQTVFGVGNLQADLLVIGEAPGADEDRQGEPFVGRAGQLLNAMLLAMGFQRESVFIANIVKCRPPDNRDPKPQEALQCEPYLLRQIELLRPRMILAVGRIAAQNLLKTEITVGKLRGRIHAYGERHIPLVVTYHPAYLLRSPEQKGKAWQDLQLALSGLRGEGL
jgi:uracil-DNA glycosylase